MSRFKDNPALKGIRFNSLTVLGRIPGGANLALRCLCGKTEISDVESTLTGKVIGCSRCQPITNRRGRKNPREVGEKTTLGLTVISVPCYVPPRGKLGYVYRCPCGTIASCCVADLEKIASCGCSRKTHGMSQTSLYRIWAGIKRRTQHPPSTKSSQCYDGVAMHLAWIKSFEMFQEYVLKEMGERPTLEHSIDRIDNNKGYEPGNLRWATPALQARNRRTTKVVVFQEREWTLTDLADFANLPVSVVAYRHRNNWPIEEIVSTPSAKCLNKTSQFGQALTPQKVGSHNPCSPSLCRVATASGCMPSVEP